MKRTLLALGALSLILGASARAESSRLQFAIAMCQAENVGKILQAGEDANAKDRQGKPMLAWLASGTKCTDTTALATAKELNRHGAHFQSLQSISNPSLLTRLAHRGFSSTVEYLSQWQGSGDPTEALHAIARKGDLATVRVLLAAGADPLAGPALTSSLFDAAASGQADAVSEMMMHVSDKGSAKVRAAYQFAQGNEAVAKAFLASGVKPTLAHKESACTPKSLSWSQTALMRKLGLPNSSALAGLAGAMKCRLIQECGDLALVDCNSAADGPAYYLNQKTEKLLATCGGACMKGCTSCPPPAWTCECKR